jgi:hypothetical protein
MRAGPGPNPTKNLPPTAADGAAEGSRPLAMPVPARRAPPGCNKGGRRRGRVQEELGTSPVASGRLGLDGEQIRRKFRLPQLLMALLWYSDTPRRSDLLDSTPQDVERVEKDDPSLGNDGMRRRGPQSDRGGLGTGL